MKMIRKKDFYSPAYHLYTGQGWINDPCGCGIYQDNYHIFFQYHENPVPLGPGKWFHMRSKNLVHWEELGVCLEPEFAYEENGCWTGSSVERNGEHYLYYSTNQDGRIPQQQPGIAISRDGIRYEKLPCGPTLTGETADGHCEMRDPKVIVHGSCFYMLQGATRNGRGEIVGFRSKDGISWEYTGVFFRSEKWTGNMYECPDFFSMKGKDFLLFSPMNWAGHSNVLLCGQVDYESFSFQCEQLIDLDLGSDFYAAQTLPLKDGRMGIIGWLGSWGKPHPEDKYHWAGMLSSIRVVEYDPKRQEISLSPASELRALRKTPEVVQETAVEARSAIEIPLGEGHREVRLKIKELYPGTDVLEIAIQGNTETAIRIQLDFKRNQIGIDKTMAEQGDNMKKVMSCSLKDTSEFCLYIDGSALELFTRREVITERFYLDTGEKIMKLCCPEGLALLHVTSYEMKSIYCWENKD